MCSSRPWHPVSLTLLCLSLALHFITIVLYVRLPDTFAAYTVFPIWVWGLIGIFISASTFIIYRGRFSLFITSIWLLTILFIADEAESLGRIAAPQISEGKAKPHAGGRVLRIATLNCAHRADPLQFAKSYQPDVLFLQEIPHSFPLKRAIEEVFSGAGDYRHNLRSRCAVIVGGKIEFEIPINGYRSQILTVKLNSGESLQLMNSHLQGATTNLRLWKREAWREHKANRKSRRIELAYTMGILRQKSPYHRLPTIIAGDFNAPANDAVYRLLGSEFTNAFEAVGTGWGNTYHRALPLLRIDHIFSSSKLVPLSCKTVTVEKSDHQAVVADYIFR